MATQYVSLDEFDDFIEERKNKYDEHITPWFQLLVQKSLKQWWKDIIEQGIEKGVPK